MESVAFSKHGTWEVRRSKNYAFICCPLMNQFLTFSQKKQVYTDLKDLEFKLATDDVVQIIGYTRLDKPNIMKMFTKVGYKPFHISLKKEVI